MGSRLYFNNTAAPYTPTTIRGTWNSTGSAVAKLLGSVHDTGTPTTVAIAEAVTTNNYNVLWGRWVSAPAVVAGNLSGVVSWAVGVKESSLSANDVLRVHIYVTTGSTDTPRGTLLSNYTDTVKFTTTAAGISSLDVAISTVAMQVGDRVVVEIGYQAQNTSSTSFTGTMNYGGQQFYRDLVAAQASGSNGTDPGTYYGWVQFSDPNSVLISAPTGPANRCANPALKTYSDFWSTASNTTGSRPTETGFSRTTGLHTVMGTVASPTDPSIQPNPAPASTGETWSVYAEIKGSLTSPDTTTCWLNFLDARGNFLTPNPSTTITPSGTMQQVILNGYTAPANTASINLSVEGTMSTGDTIDVTCVRYDIASSIAAYFDGDSTGWSWDNALTDGDSTSRQNNTPTSITGDTPSGQRVAGPNGAFTEDIAVTGDTPSSQRLAGPSGLGIDVTLATDSPGAQRLGGPAGAFLEDIVQSDSPTGQRSSGPDGTTALGITLTDSPSAQRLGTPDGQAQLGIIAGSDTPAAGRASGPDGTPNVDLTLTDMPAGHRVFGATDGLTALDLPVTGDTPSAERYAGPVGSVFADVGGAVNLTDGPSADRHAGPDGLVAIAVIFAGDTSNGVRSAGPDGQTTIGVSLTDGPLGARYAGPDGLIALIVGATDTPSGYRNGGPDGAMGIVLPIAGDAPDGFRHAGPFGALDIGIGSDFSVGPDNPCAVRLGGPDGQVLLAVLQPRQAYSPLTPLVIPSYALWVADTVTGRMLWELPMVTCTWSQSIGAVGTLQADLSIEKVLGSLPDQDERDPRVLLRELISGPWRFCLVLKWGNNVVWAGPFITMRRQTPAVITLGASEVAQFLAKRAMVAPGAVSATDPSANLSLGPNTTKGHAAFALINQMLSGIGNGLPINVSDPGGSGLDSRVYYGYDLADYWTKLQALSAEVDGPEVRFDPQVITSTNGDLLSWTARIGTPYVGTESTVWEFDSDVTSIVGYDMDASNQAFGVWSTGSGSSTDKLVAHVSDTTPVTRVGYPMLEMVDSSHSSETYYPIVADYAQAYLNAYKQPATTLSVQVPADTDPMVGTYRLGEDFAADIRDDPIIPDGVYRRRIAALSGSEKPWVVLTDAISTSTPTSLVTQINALVPVIDPATGLNTQ